jgi:hypothetical protein
MVNKYSAFFKKILKYSILANNIVNVHFKENKIEKEIKIFIPDNKVKYDKLIEFWNIEHNKKMLEDYFRSYLPSDIFEGKLHKRVGHKDSYEISYTYLIIEE